MNRFYDNRVAKFLSIDPLAKEYPNLTPYQFASNTPIMAIDMDGLEAWVVIETDGVGHSFIVVPTEEDNSEFVVYSYGRYMGSKTPSLGGYGPIGPGVLIRKEGQSAKDFIKERLELGNGETTFVYELPKAKDEKIRAYFDEKFNNGFVLPENSKAYEKYGEEARVIDEYRLGPIIGQKASNCVTKTCEGIIVGDSFDEFSPAGHADHDLSLEIHPISLGNTLGQFENYDAIERPLVKDANIINVTEKTKKAFKVDNSSAKEKKVSSNGRPEGPLKEDGTF